MEGGLCEAHSPGIRSPGPACKLFDLQPLSRGPRVGLRGLGLPLAAPSLPRPGSLTPRPFSPSPSGLSPGQPKPSWRRTLAAAGTQSPGAGREERGLGRWDGGVCRVRRKGGPLLPRIPAPRGLPCISRGEPRGSLTFRLLLCQRFVPGKGGPCSWWCRLAPLQWGPGRSISKAVCVCPRLRGSSVGGAGGVLGSPHLLLTGCRGFLREQRRGSQRRCPRIRPRVPSARLRWTRRRAQVQGEGGSTSHQGSQWKG